MTRVGWILSLASTFVLFFAYGTEVGAADGKLAARWADESYLHIIFSGDPRGNIEPCA
ncbi:MAG: hypothetical protein ACUVWA_09895 [Candidatus Oleimicrobiaceae bacterium]